MSDDELDRKPELQSLDTSAELEAPQRLAAQFLTRLVVGQTVAVAFLTMMVAVGGLWLSRPALLGLLPLGAIAAAVGLVSYWLLRQHQFRMGGYVFLLGTSAAITANMFMRGYQDASALYYLWPILGAIVILETRDGILIATLSGALYLVMVIVQELGYQTPPLPYDPQREGFFTVGSMVMMFALLAFLAGVSSQNLNRAFQRARQTASRWKELNETLEQRVAERTVELTQAHAHLTRRATQLQSVAEIGRAASSILDMGQLLEQVVRHISDRFGLYHAGIFMLDESREWAVLQAASSAGGRRMLARGHRLRVGQEGIVGYVSGQGEPRIASDVGADAVFFTNPDLLETRSEMALPLRARGEIIGVLDVQSAQPGAFSGEDVTTLQTLADQVAMAISNARLFQRVEESLEAERQVYSELSLRAWAEILRSSLTPGYSYVGGQVVPVGDARQPWVDAALSEGKSVTTTDPAGPVLAMPVKVRGTTIGVVDVRKDAADRSEWTAEEIALVETLTEQLSAALESARLFEEAQRLAAREQAVNTITAKIRGVPTVNTILQRTVEELGRAFGASRATLSVQVSEPVNKA